MPFFSGASTMDALIDLMANQLIATGAWGDASGGALPSGASPANRALVHLVDANFYVHIDRNIVTGFGGGSSKGSWNEIRVRISTGHTGTAPSGTIQTTGIPLEAGTLGTSTTQVTANNSNLSHWTWVDAAGFTTQVQGAVRGSFQIYACFFTLERNTSKEYADGYTNFFVAAAPNMNPSSGGTSSNNHGTYYGNGTTSSNFDAQRAFVCRPFNYQEYNAASNAVNWFFGSFRSGGNSKVYFTFPYFSNNQAPLQPSFIAQTTRFFRVEPGQGLADGDLVTYALGGNTFTYLVKTLQSASSSAYTPWAVRQA
jgi:hypothetical protein